MKNPVLNRLASTLLLLLLAASVVMSVFGITAMSVLRSQRYISSRVNAYSDTLKAEIDDAVLTEMPDGKIPASVVASAVDGNVISYINEKITTSIILQSAVDLSTDSKLYNTVIKSVNKYAESENIKLSKSEASKLASLAVDVINGCFVNGGFDNNILSRMRSNSFLAASFGGIFMVVVCIALINIVNGGRHRMYSYIGTGLVSAGYVQIIVFGIGHRYHIVNGVRYVALDAFDRVLSDAFDRVFTVQVFTGCIILAAGLVMLLLNYRYFYKKNKRVAEQRELESKMRNEYMMHYNSKNAPSTTVPGEREVMDIEF